MSKKEIIIKIYSYAFEFHQAIAILNMLCKTGKKFAWNDGLKDLRTNCKEDPEYLLEYLNEKVVQPTLNELIASCRPLGLDRSLREDFV